MKRNKKDYDVVNITTSSIINLENSLKIPLVSFMHVSFIIQYSHYSACSVEYPRLTIILSNAMLILFLGDACVKMSHETMMRDA